MLPKALSPKSNNMVERDGNSFLPEREPASTRTDDGEQGEGMPDPMQPQQMEFELPPEIQVAQALAEIEETRAGTAAKRAQGTHRVAGVIWFCRDARTRSFTQPDCRGYG